MVVMVVMNCCRDVETRGVVLTIAVVRVEELAFVVVDADPAALVAAAVVEASLFPPLLVVVVAAAAVVVVSGAADEAPLVVDVVAAGGADVVVSGAADEAAGADDATGAADDVFAAAEEVAGAADVADEAPVPSASCLLPWWRYWLIPSMWMSSRVKADETVASARTAPENQALGNMFVGFVD